MTSSTALTRRLAIGAVLSGGLFAGTTATRVLVQMPAWERLGMVPWAEFSRAENHGIGLVFFPIVGLVAILFTVGTALAYRLDRVLPASRALQVSIYGAVVLAAVGAIVTRGAIVPELFRLQTAGDNILELQGIFQRISPWLRVNDLVHLLNFGFNVWALIEIVSVGAADERGDSAAGSRDTIGYSRLPLRQRLADCACSAHGICRLATW